EARMTSRCTIRRMTGNMVIDEDNQQVPEWEVIHSDLPCRIASSPNASRSRTQSPGEAELERATPHLHVPASTTDLTDNDHAEITSGVVAGTVLRLLETDWTDQATARRVPVMAVERPTEWSA
ncbi:MAG: DUF6093 family protein, partial [Nocardioides sp.]|uniref:DUF6093 family protein n=1 Tax=Nocardioides sp. TaxID=35761 RepID=UPI003D6C1DA4